MIDNKTKIKLYLNEHFILKNISTKLPQYLFMWGIAILFAFVMCSIPIIHPVSDYDGVRAFSIAFISIAVTTITFAIPNCMRTIFASYDQYYSTKINEILLDRFPVTLLALSAFTSLIIGIGIVSGIIGISFSNNYTAMFYISLFWTMVCVGYLFIAVEKLIYFVVKAPYAVLGKLQYSLLEKDVITNKQEYKEFRRELASINDIAATIVNRSTGQDDSILNVLEFFTKIHNHFLKQATTNAEYEKLNLNACRAVDHEMVRIFRIAASSKNEQITKNVMRSYCSMMADAIERDCGIWYFSDMLSQIERMQSYADSSNVGAIRSIAYVEWFFMLFESAQIENHDSRKYTKIVHIMSSSLRKAALDKTNELLEKFYRIASDSEPDYDIYALPTYAITLLDRSVFVYLVWLIDIMPDNVQEKLDDLVKYSTVLDGNFRSVLPDSIERMKSIIEYEHVMTQQVSVQEAKSKANQDALVLMSMHKEMNGAAAIATLFVCENTTFDEEELNKCGEMGSMISRNISKLKTSKDQNVIDRYNLTHPNHENQ